MRPHFEVLTPVHKRQIEDNSGKQTSPNQVSVKSALRITDQSSACNRIIPEAGKKIILQPFVKSEHKTLLATIQTGKGF